MNCLAGILACGTQLMSMELMCQLKPTVDDSGG